MIIWKLKAGKILKLEDGPKKNTINFCKVCIFIINIGQFYKKKV